MTKILKDSGIPEGAEDLDAQEDISTSRGMILIIWMCAFFALCFLNPLLITCTLGGDVCFAMITGKDDRIFLILIVEFLVCTFSSLLWAIHRGEE